MSKFLAQCLRLGLVLVLAAAVTGAEVKAVDKEMPPLNVEQSTESPIADMALIEDAPVVPKLPTEKPPVAAQAEAATADAAESVMPAAKAQPSDERSTQPHTVADFIIHPLIAFKPRQATVEEMQAQSQGKQASGGSSTSSSPGTWLFGMNPGQGLGSSFSTLAGSVSGWFNDRLAAAGQQLPALPGLQALVDTPVRDSATTSSTTSTTTQRPDIVVRLQQRPIRRRGNGNGNLNGLGNGNGIRNGNRNGNRKGNRNGNRQGNGNRIQQRPNRFDNHLDSLESLEVYDDVDYYNGNRYDEFYDDDDQDVQNDEEDQSLEPVDDDDEDEQLDQQSAEEQPLKQKPKQRRRPAQTQVVRRKQQQQQTQSQLQSQPLRRGQPLAVLQQADEEEEEEDDDAEVEQDDDDESDNQETFEPVIYKQSSRRSQNQPGFIQSGQQNLINQIRRFTFGQTPGEIGSKIRQSQVSQSPSRAAVRRPQQATLLVNRNGQTVYVAPELLGLSPNYPSYGYVAPPSTKVQKQQQQRLPFSPYPQPPLTVPLRRKGRPTQYITIPWSQLGLSAPDRQSMVSLAEGIQAQPLIFNIPESAISSVPVRGSTATQQKKRKRPTLTAAAVPLLADASLMDIFQPPQIPPSRSGSPVGVKPKPKPKPKPTPVLITAKPVQAGLGASLLPTRIRPGTIVEKAPAMENAEKTQTHASDNQKEQPEKATAEAASAASEMAMATDNAAAPATEQEFIIVGDDDEPGVSRHVQPVFGDARYVSYGDLQPYFDLVHQNRRFALRKTGRALEPEADVE